MAFSTSNVFDRNAAAFAAGKRLIINRGGTSSSKTFSILQLLIYIALQSTKPIIISVVSESLPHLKRGCIRDFKKILGDNWNELAWNATDYIYRGFPNCTFEFFPADDASKLRGGRRDLLFINECNNTPKSAFDELDTRTRLATFLDYNPVAEFWAMELEKLPQSEYIHSTYLDAVDFLDPETVYKIECRRERDPNWWRVYGLGEVGNVEGLVHPIFKESPMPGVGETGKELFGLDFGFTNDPSALVRVIIVGKDMYAEQLMHESGLTNPQISRRMQNLGLKKGVSEIFADSAEPKSIEELRLMGWNIKAAPKGRDSVRQGINKVNSYHQHWTPESLDAIKEMRRYSFEKDKISGKILNEVVDDWNHLMDARRYATVNVGNAQDRRVWPMFTANQAQPFLVSWKPVPGMYYHYGCIFWAKDLNVYRMQAKWNAVTGRLYVYAAGKYQGFNPEAIAKDLKTSMHIGEFPVTRILGNEPMFEEIKNPALYLHRALRVACGTKIVPMIVPPYGYDENGAIVNVASHFLEKSIAIHSDLQEVAGAVAGWALDDRKRLPENPYAQSLCLIASELRQDLMKETKSTKPNRGYHPVGKPVGEPKRTFMSY